MGNLHLSSDNGNVDERFMFASLAKCIITLWVKISVSDTVDETFIQKLMNRFKNWMLAIVRIIAV